MGEQRASPASPVSRTKAVGPRSLHRIAGVLTGLTLATLALGLAVSPALADSAQLLSPSSDLVYRRFFAPRRHQIGLQLSNMSDFVTDDRLIRRRQHSISPCGAGSGNSRQTRRCSQSSPATTIRNNSVVLEGDKCRPFYLEQADGLALSRPFEGSFWFRMGCIMRFESRHSQVLNAAGKA